MCNRSINLYNPNRLFSGGIVNKDVIAMIGCYNSSNDIEAIIPLLNNSIEIKGELTPSQMEQLKREIWIGGFL